MARATDGAGCLRAAARSTLVRPIGAGLALALSAGGAVRAQTPPPPAAPAPAATAQQAGQLPVVVRGNQRIETGTILAYLGLKRGQQVTAPELNAGVRRLFDTGLFSDVRVVPENGQLVVQVAENPSINEIAFEGNHSLKDSDLQQLIRLRPRLPFTRSAAEADAQVIIDTYRKTGRYGASVEPYIIKRPDNRVDVVFQIKEGPLTGVSAIDFVGNEAFSDRRLRGVIETKESGLFSHFLSTDVYNPDKLEVDRQDLRQFYLDRGYADFAILSTTAELSPNRSGFYITFTVNEGPVYRFGKLDVQVNAPGLKAADFQNLIPNLTGETYSASEVEKIANKLTDLAGQKGFAFVQVRPRATKNEKTHTIDITFDLNQGEKIYIERINVNGNHQTLDRVIRREIPLAEGDAFDARKIRDAQRNIRALGYFKSVDIKAVPGSADDRAVLDVDVDERSTGSFSIGLGFSTSAGPIGSLSISENNFLGRGQQVKATVTAAGRTQVYDFSFTEPHVLDRDLAAGFRAFYINDNRTNTSNFFQRSAGVTPSIGFPLSEFARLSTRYTFLYNNIRPDVYASQLIQNDAGTTYASGFGYTLTYDRRNDPVETTAGYLLSLSQDVAGAGGTEDYVKGRASAKGWHGFFNNNLVTSLEVEGGAIEGFANTNPSITERYFLGSDSFRGFAIDGIGPRDFTTRDALGGKYYAVARAQVSFPIGLPKELGIYGGAFVDAGTLWGLDRTSYVNATTGQLVTIDDTPHLRVSAGALLFVDSPFGPLALSLGFPVLKQHGDKTELFRFSVGTRF